MRFVIKDLFLEIKENFELLKSDIPNIDGILCDIDQVLHINSRSNEISEWLENNESVILKINNHLTQLKN